MYIFLYQSIRKQRAIKIPRSTKGHHLNRLCWAQVRNAAYQALRPLALPFRRRNLLNGFNVYGCGGHLGHVTQTPRNKPSFPRSMEAPHEIRFRLTQRFLRRRLKMVDDDGRTDDGACLYYKLIYEPKGSVELKVSSHSI